MNKFFVSLNGIVDERIHDQIWERLGSALFVRFELNYFNVLEEELKR